MSSIFAQIFDTEAEDTGLCVFYLVVTSDARCGLLAAGHNAMHGDGEDCKMFCNQTSECRMQNTLNTSLLHSQAILLLLYTILAERSCYV